MKYLFSIFLSLFILSAQAKKPKHQYIRVSTEMGECIIQLYNETPLHRDNFIKLTKAGFYNNTLFHRVIKDFMIQGGDPDSKKAEAGKLLGEGDVGYTIPAEFRDSLFHKKGVLAAARDDNPQKASSGCQFYIVQGKKFTDEQLDAIETNRLHFKLPQWQREIYKTTGGTPHLDRNYTAFGEVVQGIEMVDLIAVSPTDSNNRPLKDIKMTVTLLKKRAAKKLEKILAKQKQTQGNA
ncbi:peptidylprolyl isomerase [Pedobacter sp.]|jgi:cyclophilin family peptidyl-prolyl cis-trans isomerase|uniref:peptidylprolyl isomerase n=1 Tax=Pedobacter sp. TaxID=1411316 RepID=UPI002C6CBC99|nr:peptidylprolyl isomerase [Pedobacter sp.]HWW39167.1 peptidylprolyl isomerase [Pedobacter sp.]